MTTKETTKAVKQVLVNLFKGQNAKVSAHSGSGTASGWVRAGITIPKPLTCNCQPNQTYCINCKTAINMTSDVANKAIKEAKIDFYTYSTDYGYDSTCYLLDVSLV